MFKPHLKRNILERGETVPEQSQRLFHKEELPSSFNDEK
jgi:hypothetical protein